MQNELPSLKIVSERSVFKFQDRKGYEEVGNVTSRYCVNISAFFSFGRIPRIDKFLNNISLAASAFVPLFDIESFVGGLLRGLK